MSFVLTENPVQQFCNWVGDRGKQNHESKHERCTEASNPYTKANADLDISELAITILDSNLIVSHSLRYDLAKYDNHGRRYDDSSKATAENIVQEYRQSFVNNLNRKLSVFLAINMAAYFLR